jgi:hypothetical protein
VTGHTDLSALLTGPRALELLAQRDAVFSVLCEMAHTEVATLEAQERMVNLLDPKRVTFRPTEEVARPSAQSLILYVERLIEQVGDLS